MSTPTTGTTDTTCCTHCSAPMMRRELTPTRRHAAALHVDPNPLPLADVLGWVAAVAVTAEAHERSEAESLADGLEPSPPWPLYDVMGLVGVAVVDQLRAVVPGDSGDTDVHIGHELVCPRQLTGLDWVTAPAAVQERMDAHAARVVPARPVAS